MNILVTGSAGYIGATFSYTCLQKGHSVLGVDSYINSSSKHTETLKETFKNFEFIECDLSSTCLEPILDKIQNKKIDIVVHFAALKAVGQSDKQPFLYWRNNILASMNLVEIMEKCEIKKLIFSSSATVYGDTSIQPISESASLQTLSTYGSTKIASEYLFNDISKGGIIDVINLRYFNPVGTHAEKLIFEDPYSSPNNLMPRIVRVGLGLDSYLSIFGDDYATSDGTGERDYIHIDDLIDGHFSALDYIKDFEGTDAFNLGTGVSVSVKELIKTFETVNNIEIPHKIEKRRRGDVEVCFADPAKAQEKLNWEAKKDIKQMCKDAWAPFC